jgi:hypothetical protein
MLTKKPARTIPPTPPAPTKRPYDGHERDDWPIPPRK